MDPLVATGLAGNVVQFVDFSYKVVSTARKFYKSAGGAIAENQELEALARDLCELAKKDNVKTLSKYMRDVIPPKTKRQPDDEDFREDEIIRQLSQQCIDISEDLIRNSTTAESQGRQPSMGKCLPGTQVGLEARRH
jgi:hypothetical protein